MTEAEIKLNFSKNLSALRKSRKLTQAELAEKLNYSDKSVSKWERGDVLPDIVTFSMIAEYFGISVDELVSGDKPREVAKRGKRWLIALLSAVSVMFLATIGALFYSSFQSFDYLWLFYLYALPVVSIVMIVFSSIWFGTRATEISISALVWTLGVSIYLSVLEFASKNLWFVFVLCGVFQVLILIWFAIVEKARREKSSEDVAEEIKEE